MGHGELKRVANHICSLVLVTSPPKNIMGIVSDVHYKVVGVNYPGIEQARKYLNGLRDCLY